MRLTTSFLERGSAPCILLRQRFSAECDTVVQSVTYVVLWIVDSPSILQIKETSFIFLSFEG